MPVEHPGHALQHDLPRPHRPHLHAALLKYCAESTQACAEPAGAHTAAESSTLGGKHITGLRTQWAQDRVTTQEAHL